MTRQFQLLPRDVLDTKKRRRMRTTEVADQRFLDGEFIGPRQR